MSPQCLPNIVCKLKQELFLYSWTRLLFLAPNILVVYHLLLVHAELTLRLLKIYAKSVKT